MEGKKLTDRLKKLSEQFGKVTPPGASAVGASAPQPPDFGSQVQSRAQGTAPIGGPRKQTAPKPSAPSPASAHMTPPPQPLQTPNAAAIPTTLPGPSAPLAPTVPSTPLSPSSFPPAPASSTPFQQSPQFRSRAESLQIKDQEAQLRTYIAELSADNAQSPDPERAELIEILRNAIESNNDSFVRMLYYELLKQQK